MMKLTIPEMSLVVLIGASGAGKSTFAREHFQPTEVLSSDFCRGLVADDENDQRATPDAFDLLHYIARKRLAAGRVTVVDATNVQPAARKPLVALAREYHCLPVAIVFDLPEKLCHERNRRRPDRDFGPQVIRRHVGDLRRGLRGLRGEGFRYIYTLRSPEDVTALVLEAVQRGVSSVPALRHELGAGERNHSALLRRALAIAELGVWSLPEYMLEAVLARSRRLPPVMANPILHTAAGERLPTPDGWLDDVALAIQVHSLRWHALGAQWEGTVIKDSAFVEHGITVVAFTPQRIEQDPDWVVGRVERIHAALCGRGRPAVTARPRLPLHA